MTQTEVKPDLRTLAALKRFLQVGQRYYLTYSLTRPTPVTDPEWREVTKVGATYIKYKCEDSQGRVCECWLHFSKASEYRATADGWEFFWPESGQRDAGLLIYKVTV